MVLRPYSAYKQSDVKWLGEVPAHWEIHRLKSSTVNVVEQTVERDHVDLCLALEQVESWTGSFREAGTDVAFDSQMKRFRADDVLFGKLRPYLAKVVRPDRDGLCVGEFLVLRLRNGAMDAGYLEHILRSKSVIDAIASSTYGARMPRADWQFIGSMEYPYPPSDEQAAIVRFLDHLARRIQRYISAKERLIELLNEQKQAIINQAVTRGLDPDVSLEPSGVEWLGDVPSHWEVKRAKYFYREVDERSSSGMEELMSVSHKTGVTPRKRNVTMFMAGSNIGYRICRPGDIAINTMWAYMAALGVARQVGLISPSYGVYRPRADRLFNPDYIDPLLRTEGYRSEYLCRSTGITSSRLRLYPDSFLGIPLLHPPFEEQGAIVEYLGKATAEADNLISRAHRQIDLIQEYRTRMIADVVTGKLDVRNALDELDQGAELVTAGSQQLELDVGR